MLDLARAVRASRRSFGTPPSVRVGLSLLCLAVCFGSARASAQGSPPNPNVFDGAAVGTILVWEDSAVQIPMIEHIQNSHLPTGLAPKDIRLVAVPTRPADYDAVEFGPHPTDESKTLLIRPKADFSGVDSIVIESWSPTNVRVDWDTIRVDVRETVDFAAPSIAIRWGQISVQDLSDNLATPTDPSILVGIKWELRSPVPLEGGRISLDRDTGILTIDASPPLEMPWTDTIRVEIIDTREGSPSQIVRIPLTISPLPNQPPTANAEGRFTRYGGNPPYRFDLWGVFDDDRGDASLTFSLVGGDRDTLFINGHELTYVASDSHWVGSIPNVEVVATDKGGLTGRITVTVQILPQRLLYPNTVRVRAPLIAWEDDRTAVSLIDSISSQGEVPATSILLTTSPFDPSFWDSVGLATGVTEAASRALVLIPRADVFGMDSLIIEAWSPTGVLFDRDIVRVSVQGMAEFDSTTEVIVRWGKTTRLDLRQRVGVPPAMQLDAYGWDVQMPVPDEIAGVTPSDTPGVFLIAAQDNRADIVVAELLFLMRDPRIGSPLRTVLVPLRLIPVDNSPPRPSATSVVWSGGKTEYRYSLNLLFKDDDNDPLSFRLVTDHDDTIGVEGAELIFRPRKSGWFGSIYGVEIAASDGKTTTADAIALTVLEPLRITLQNESFIAPERSVMTLRLSDYVSPPTSKATWSVVSTGGPVEVLGFTGNRVGAEETGIRIRLMESSPLLQGPVAASVSLLVTDFRGNDLAPSTIPTSLDVSVVHALNTPPVFSANTPKVEIAYPDTASLALSGLVANGPLTRPSWTIRLDPRGIVDTILDQGSQTARFLATSAEAQGQTVTCTAIVHDRTGVVPITLRSGSIAPEPDSAAVTLPVVVLDRRPGLVFHTPARFDVYEDSVGVFYRAGLVDVLLGTPSDLVWAKPTCTDPRVQVRFDRFANDTFLVITPDADYAIRTASLPEVTLKAHIPGRPEASVRVPLMVHPVFDIEIPPQSIDDGGVVQIALDGDGHVSDRPSVALRWGWDVASPDLEVVENRVIGNSTGNAILRVRPRERADGTLFTGTASLRIFAETGSGLVPRQRDTVSVSFAVSDRSYMPARLKRDAVTKYTMYTGRKLSIPLDLLLEQNRPPLEPSWTDCRGRDLNDADTDFLDVSYDADTRVIEFADRGKPGEDVICLTLEQWHNTPGAHRKPLQVTLTVRILPALRILVDPFYETPEGIPLRLQCALGAPVPDVSNIRWSVTQGRYLDAGFNIDSTDTTLVVTPLKRFPLSQAGASVLDSVTLIAEDTSFAPSVLDSVHVRVRIYDVPSSPPEFAVDSVVWEVPAGDTIRRYLPDLLLTGLPDHVGVSAEAVPPGLHIEFRRSQWIVVAYFDSGTAFDANVRLVVADRVGMPGALIARDTLAVLIRAIVLPRRNDPPHLMPPGVLTWLEGDEGTSYLRNLARDDYTPSPLLVWTFPALVEPDSQHSPIRGSPIWMHRDTLDDGFVCLRFRGPADYFTDCDTLIPFPVMVTDQDGATTGPLNLFLHITPLPDISIRPLWIPANDTTTYSLPDSGSVEWGCASSPERYQDLQLTFRSLRKDSAFVAAEHPKGSTRFRIWPLCRMKFGRDTLEATLWDSRYDRYDRDTVAVEFGTFEAGRNPRFLRPQYTWRAREGHTLVVPKDTIVYDDRWLPKYVKITRLDGCPDLVVTDQNSPYVYIYPVDPDWADTCVMRLVASGRTQHPANSGLIDADTTTAIIIYEEVHDIVLDTSEWVTDEDVPYRVPLDSLVVPRSFAPRLKWEITPIPATDNFRYSLDRATRTLTLTPRPETAFAPHKIRLIATDVTTGEADTAYAFFAARLIDNIAPRWRWGTVHVTVLEDGETVFPEEGRLTDPANLDDPDTRLDLMRIAATAHNCTVEQVGGKIRIRPAPNWFGKDSVIVTARDTGGNENSFTIIVTVEPVPGDPPNPIALLYPPPDTNQTTLYGRYTWTGGEDPDRTLVRYCIVFDTLSTFARPLRADTVTARWYDLTAPLPRARYIYWRVTGISDDGRAESEVRRFSTFPPEGPVGLTWIHPTTDGVSDGDKYGLFSVRALAGNTRGLTYRLFIATNDSMGDPYVVSSLGSTISTADVTWWKELVAVHAPVYYRLCVFEDHDRATLQWAGPARRLNARPSKPRLVPDSSVVPLSRTRIFSRSWVRSVDVDDSTLTYHVRWRIEPSSAQAWSELETEGTVWPVPPNAGERYTVQWFVEACDRPVGGLSAASDTETIAVIPFELLSPNRAETPSEPPTFAWTPYALSTTAFSNDYYVDIARDETCVSHRVPSGQTRYTSKEVFVPSATYRWRVREVTSGDSTEWRSFRMAPSVNQVPRWNVQAPLADPPDGPVVRAEGSVPLSWWPAYDPNNTPAAIIDTIWYIVRIYFDMNGQPGDLFQELAPTGGCSQVWQVNRTFHARAFWWTVVARDQAGLESDPAGFRPLFVRLFELQDPLRQSDGVVKLPAAPEHLAWEPFAWYDTSAHALRFADRYHLRLTSRRLVADTTIWVNPAGLGQAVRIPWTSLGVSYDAVGEYALRIVPLVAEKRMDSLFVRFAFGTSVVWMNRPNPFTDETEFVFQYPERIGNSAMVYVYAPSGALVETFALDSFSDEVMDLRKRWRPRARLPYGLYAAVLVIRTDNELPRNMPNRVLKVLVAPRSP